MNQKTLILLICLFAISYQHGVHRVAQSMWNYPNFGSTTKLYLFFSLDNALPAGGVMNIALPASMSAFVPTTCNAWALTSDLTPPATTSGFFIGKIVSTTGCQFYTYAATAGTLGTYGGAVGLLANTAYGVELYMSGGGALAIGSFAPIAITTRSGYDASVTTGPMLGCNPAFDMVFVIAAPLGFTTAATRVADATSPACAGLACNSAKTQPGDAAMYVFSIGTWSGTTVASVIPAPYNIEFSFTKQGNNGAYVYGTWSFATSATSVTSTQFGVAMTNGTLPVMSVAKPASTYAANAAGLFLKTIVVTAAADDMRPAAAWSTWIVSFTMEVTNPADLVDTNPTLNTIIYNPDTNYIYAQSLADSTTVFRVVIGSRTATSFDVASDSVARVAFGANPMTSAGHLYGAGIYSEVFCVGSLEYNPGEHATAKTANVATLPSNCAAITAVNLQTLYAAAVGVQPARSVNAIELAWTIPLAIPADTTGAVVTCNVDTAKIDTTNSNYRFFKIHQASLATDVSKGNCWYSSTNSDTTNFWQREIITCSDMAKVSANDILTIGFQFEIFQHPYIAYKQNYADMAAGQKALATVAGANKVWTAGVVVKTINTLTCAMVITAGGKAWYTQSIIVPVDGTVTAGDAKDFASYSTFITQQPATALVLDHLLGRWAYPTNTVNTLTHTWQVEPAATAEFSQATGSNQDLTIALMFYIGDCYSDISALAWANVGGRKIPMVLKAAMNLKFYLYGAHTFSSSTTLKAQWQGYSTGTSGTSLLTFVWQWNTVGANAGLHQAASMYFGGSYALNYNGGGGLNVCAADGAYDTTNGAGGGLCSTITSFTNTYTQEGGKVFVSATSAAGGFTTGAANSKFLQKACITNGATAATGGNLLHMLQSCKIPQAHYMAVKGTSNAHGGTGDFYVMFAGALTNFATGLVGTGFTAGSFVATGDAYTFADRATYHKFTYLAAYARSTVTWMTTFRGRGGQGASAKQGLETFFWGVKDNGTSATNTWVISTMIHTYIAPKLAQLAGAPGDTFVTVSWPAWVEAFANDVTPLIDQNDGMLFFNTMKMTVQNGYAGDAVFKANNAYVGAFVPRGQAFMKSTGDNQVEAVSTQTGTTCYLYGSQSGESYQVFNVGNTKFGNAATDALRIFKHGNALGAQLDTNFLVCSVGTITSAGVVTVIPFTNTYASLTAKHSSELLVLIHGDWAWKLCLVIGSDRNMFFVGFYPTGTAVVANTDYLNEIAANRFFSAGNPVVMIATSELSGFQVDGVTHADFKIGATGVKSSLVATLATSPSGQNWLTGKLDLAQICGDPTYLMGSNTGDVNTGTAAVTTAAHMCLKHTQSVKLVNNMVTAMTITTSRECWYCPYTAGAAMSWIILKFRVPVTTNRKVSGFAVQLSMGTGTKLYNSPATAEGAILSNVDTITQCGVTPASLQYNVKGKQVAWSVTSPTPLAGGWVVKFVGSTAAVGFFAVTPTASATTTCGTKVLATAGTMVVDVSNARSFISFTLAAIPNVPATSVGLITYAAACDGASKFTATVNNWKPSGTATAITAGNCVILNAASLEATNTGLIGGDANNGATSMAAGLAFDQSVAGTASTLGITDISFYPTVSASYGRLRFRPSMGAGPALYAGLSIFTYTFGSAAFSTGNVCYITDSTFTTQSSVVSSCVASGSGVTIKMSTAATSATFGVEVIGTTFSWAQTVQSISATLSNFADTVQSNPSAQVTLAALPATQTVKTTLVLAKTYKMTMDLGTFMFTTTIKTVNGTFNSSQWAMIQFPTYYRSDLGAGVLCNVNFNGTTTEPVWCELMWDYTLKVWGPITNAQFYNVAFNISVMGVDNVNPAAARNFQVGFSKMSAGSSLTLTDSDCLMEFMTVVDTVETTGWASALTSLKVWSYTSSGAETRSTTQVVIKFQVPTTAANTISDITLGYVTLHLPKMWGNVIQSSTSLTTKLEQQATTTPFGMTEIGATSPATFSGCSVTVWMTGTTNKFVQGSNYTLTVGGIPTSQSAVANTKLMFPVLSVGKQTTGGLGWSDSSHNWMPTTNPTFAVKTKYTELQFSATSYTVNQGTYTSGLCIMPTGTDAKFNSNIEFAIVGNTFKTAPAKLTAKQGDVSVCASIGTSTATAQSWYWVTFTAASTKYTALPYLKVMVSNTKGIVSNTNEAACTLGYSSVPIKVGYNTAPFSDVIVTLNIKDLVNASIAPTLASNNPSFGLTPTATQKTVTLSQLVSSGILSFQCLAFTTAEASLNTSVTTKLWYNLTGTDKASFTLQNADVKATGLVNRTVQIPSPVLALTQNNASSTAAMTYVNAGCPEVGTAYVWFAPSATTQPTATTLAAVKSLADAYMASTQALGYDSAMAHKSDQWFQVPVISTNSPPVAADYVSASFNTVSNKTYTSMLYCASSTDYFYILTTPLALTSKDNGGKVSNVVLTYTQYFDEATNNVELLEVAGALATLVMIANDRVSDRWGGISGKASLFLPATAFTPQTAVTVTNTTNATNASNTTTRLLAAASYPVNLFIQPDPTVATAKDSTTWTTDINKYQSELSAVTNKFGTIASITASTVAPSITEVAVTFSTDPTATSNADGSSVAVAGAVAGDSYVYCAFQKTGTAAATTARRILANTTNATANTTTTTPAAATTTTAAVATSMTSWSEASWKEYHFQRSTTSATVPAFTQSYAPTVGGSSYKWACQGTSLNPVAANAQYMTQYKEGTVTATLAVTVGAGSLFSTIAAISFIIIAAFFY